MAENGQALIKLDGVTKVFFTDEVETHALSGIHLQIDKGEYVAIAGPSGCGKSTLLSILGLLDSPTEGQFTLNGGRSPSSRHPSARGFGTARSDSSSRAST
jgi:putative ABC transport system ATP-binding protein